MSEPKFTPGPWKISEYRNGHSMIIEGSDEWDVAEVGYPNRDPNAHLIAAAPDLYKALEQLEPYLDAIICYASTVLEHKPNGFVLDAQAALRKARGEG